MKHLIKLALILNAGVAAAFVWLFSSPFGWLIGALAAGSLVGTYIGLAFADIPAEQRPRALWVAGAACSVEALYGFLYVLSQQSPEWFAAPMPIWLSVCLAALHGSAFSVLAFFISLFVVHSWREADAPSAIERRDQLLIEALERLLPRLDAPALPGTMPVAEIAAVVSAETTTAPVYACPKCAAQLSQSQYGAAKRHGHCAACKER